MEIKDAIHAIILATSLFTLSLLLFSQGVNSLSVTLGDQPLAVKVPTLFPMEHVLLMIIISAIGSHSLTILSHDRFKQRIDDNENSTNVLKNSEPVDVRIIQEVKTPELEIEPEDNSIEDKVNIASSILEGDEKKVYRIISEKGEILQSELVLESGFTKVKISRLLKKLERKSLIKRKPYGNTNKIMILK